ncbi:MAG: MotA/TolQ/ExbB proton channel family protein [Verrucomicrobia bacterium]|nr:MotA/TolQ/ExbB proton channel family protein [Verrucomicrobiota bacterium]
MKKILILTASFSMLFAEDPATLPASEQQAKQEIENFLNTDENSALQASQPTPIESQKVQVAAPTIPASAAPAGDIVPTQAVELNTDSPTVKSPALTTPQGVKNAALPPAIVEQTTMDLEEDIAAIEKEEKEVAAEVKSEGIVIDLGQVFAGSPTIYTVLFCLSIASIAIWAYAFLSLRTPELIPEQPVQEIREKLLSKNYDEALMICEKNPNILFRMMSAGILARKQGQTTMLELMKAEGRRASHQLWQKTALLNDIAVIAPMLGLLGTVLGMFYAFYDLNRSMESISALFDGLGISVGTTVGGLVVAILALMFHAMTKYRLSRQLTLIENEAHSLANLIDNQG